MMMIISIRQDGNAKQHVLYLFCKIMVVLDANILRKIFVVGKKHQIQSKMSKISSLKLVNILSFCNENAKDSEIFSSVIKTFNLFVLQFVTLPKLGMAFAKTKLTYLNVHLMLETVANKIQAYLVKTALATPQQFIQFQCVGNIFYVNLKKRGKKGKEITKLTFFFSLPRLHYTNDWRFHL